MRLFQLGWDVRMEHLFCEIKTDGCVPACISEENKGYYRVLAESGEFLAQVTGSARYHADERGDLPAVGDWVAIRPRPAERRATIVATLPRRTVLVRKMPGRTTQKQILATNLDVAFVVTSLNQEFNLRRIERYLAVVWDSGAKPVVLLNKADLQPDVESAIAMVRSVAPEVDVHSLSAITGEGLDSVRQHLEVGRTAAFIGSSGVGKSTIINRLAATPAQRVQPIRASDDRGQHTTTSRQLILLPSGGIIVDTPGMREMQLWTQDAGLSQAFGDLESLATHCRFRDCSHGHEPDCAVRKAIEDGQLPFERLENFHKMEAELRFLKSKTDVRTQQAVKQRAKRACKALKRRMS